MKTLTAFNQTASDNPDVDIVKIVKIELSGLTLYLCDRNWGDAGSECIFDGQLYEPIILTWNAIECGEINANNYDLEPSQAGFVVDNSVPIGGANRFSALKKSYDLQYADVLISEIFVGASVTADRTDIFKGTIEDLISMTAIRVTVTLC